MSIFRSTSGSSRNYRSPLPHLFLALLIPVFFAAPPAEAQSSAAQRVQRFLDEIERGLGYVGKKAEELIGPGLGIGEEPEAAFTATRPFEERLPVGPAPTIYISNEFGTINVSTWEERVVQVHAEISVGAENEAIAEEVADTIKISVRNDQELVEIRNLLPEQRQDAAYLSITVNYTVTVPTNANVITDNFFGDTAIRGVGGAVAAEAQYGGVELTDLRGTVTVRMHGEFPLKAYGLQQGGEFELHGAQAEFTNISGNLSVSNFRGSLLFRELGRESTVDIDSDSGPVRIILRDDEMPELTATVLSGKVESSMDLTRVLQGKKTIARLANLNARQRILVNATFGDVFIEQETPQTEVQQSVRQGDEPIVEQVTLEEAAPEGTFLTIDATLGDVRVEATDEEVVRVQARRVVWVPAASRGPDALRALRVEAQRAAGQLTIQSLPTDQLAALEVSAYKVDLTVQCPRNVPLTIRAQQGVTTVTGMAAPIDITQAKGEVVVDRCENQVRVTNNEGNLTVRDTIGPVETVARYGTLTLARIVGKIVSENTQGLTIVEEPGGDVVVRHSAGDVSVLTMSGIGGNFDISVRQGDLRIILPENANAELKARTQNGNIDSSTRSLSGTILGDVREFGTRLQDGLHTVNLEAVDGNIVID